MAQIQSTCDLHLRLSELLKRPYQKLGRFQPLLLICSQTEIENWSSVFELFAKTIFKNGQIPQKIHVSAGEMYSTACVKSVGNHWYSIGLMKIAPLLTKI